MLSTSKRAVLTAALTAFLLPAAGSGQVTTNPAPMPSGSVSTRAELEALLVEYDEITRSSAYSNELKTNAAARAAMIRQRLVEGDFMIGDAIVLSVRNEPTLPDTATVVSGADGPEISLPLFGSIPLRGVLRSELQEHLTEALGRFIRDPEVRAEGLMRLSVLGAVNQPGFYVMPANTLLSAALMAAGGPAQNSNLEEMRIERGTETIHEGRPLQEELRLGRTLDQLSLQAGDQVFVPAQGNGFWSGLLTIVGVASSIGFLVFQVAR